MEEQTTYETMLAEVLNTDSGLEKQLWHSTLRNYVLLGTVGLLTIGCVWGWSRKHHTEILIQPVTVREQQIQAVGKPVRLVDYQYDDAQWMDFLRDWIRLVRPRNGDPKLSTKALWQQAGHHVCGDATKWFAFYEAQERPFIVHPVQVWLGKDITFQKISDKQFRASWTEHKSKDGQPSSERWGGIFRVAKFTPKVPTENYQGMCVAWFSWSIEGTL